MYISCILRHYFCNKPRRANRCVRCGSAYDHHNFPHLIQWKNLYSNARTHMKEYTQYYSPLFLSSLSHLLSPEDGLEQLDWRMIECKGTSTFSRLAVSSPPQMIRWSQRYLLELKCFENKKVFFYVETTAT